MPILSENKSRYPENWKEIREQILQRANNKCEFCGVKNYSKHPVTGSKVILTIAHLDHTPENNNFKNLRALCQKCHNSYDIQHRIMTRKKRVDKPISNNKMNPLGDFIAMSILDDLRKARRPLTTKQIANRLNRNWATIRKHSERLCNAGLIEKRASIRRIYWELKEEKK